MQLGLLDLPWWGDVLVMLGLTHITIAAVTIFLHRHQAHRALALHPVAGHFFRFWLWLTTGMVTREWLAIHRKHHAYITSARFSNRWWEVDIGWMYIRILAMLHLAKVRKVAPSIHYNPSKTRCDADTLQAVITHRYDVLAKFARSLRRTAVDEIRSLRASAPPELKDARALDAVKHWLQRDARELPEKERVVLEQALHSSPVPSTIASMRQDLTALWSRSTASKEQLVKQLEDWCRRAEASGIGALREFSRTLRRYDSLSGDMK